ncbi:hypothetical protein VTO42DRAFT_1894 [Malbranchea cinnamomea]
MTVLRLLTRGPVTGDMISPPLSPQSEFNFSFINPSVHTALEYVSCKLQRKLVHLTFIISPDKPLPIGQGCKIHAYSISPLDQQTRRLFHHVAHRAARKFALQPDWITHHPPHMHNWEHIVRRSLEQNDIVFSQEGLTLLNIDRIYALKRQLSVLSKGTTDHIPENVYMDSCVWLLRQIMKETRGRPLTKGFFHCVYDHLHVCEELLTRLATEYWTKYKQHAIVFPKPKPTGRNLDSSTTARTRIKPTSLRRRGVVLKRPSSFRRLPSNASSTMSSSPSLRLGPKTPQSASDVTPITRSEWNLFMQGAWGEIGRAPTQQMRKSPV